MRIPMSTTGKRGRPSAYQERANAEFLEELFFRKFDQRALQDFIDSGKYAFGDKFIEMALQGNTKVLIAIFNRIFPEVKSQEINSNIIDELRALVRM